MAGEPERLGLAYVRAVIAQKRLEKAERAAQEARIAADKAVSETWNAFSEAARAGGGAK